MKEKPNVILNLKYTLHNVTQSVLLNLHRQIIFEDLKYHCNDQGFLTCHKTQLTKSIIIKYSNIRYFYIAKQTKILVLVKGIFSIS